MLVWVKAGGKNFSLTLPSGRDTTISELKTLLREINVNPEPIRFADRVLSEGTVGDAGIEDQNEIVVDSDLMKFSEMDSYHVIHQFNEFSPDWREFSDGLNLEGICENAKCAAAGKRVWAIAGFGDFNIKNEARPCPVCKAPIEVIDACGFYDCDYTITGVNQKNETISVSYSAGKYIKYYNSGIVSNNWKSLIFSVSKHT